MTRQRKIHRRDKRQAILDLLLSFDSDTFEDLDDTIEACGMAFSDFVSEFEGNHEEALKLFTNGFNML